MSLPLPSFCEGDPRWANVQPTLEEEAKFKRIVPIAYPPEYKEVMAYFWHVHERGELSERVLDLTTHIIDVCEGHYTVWYPFLI